MTTPLSPAERNTINMADLTFKALSQPARDLGVYTYALYDDADNTSHGTFETLEEAKGAASYDRLKSWTVYHKNQIVFSHETTTITTTITLSPADVVALDEFVTKAQDVNGFDYARQAWVIKGRYIKCGHLPEHHCKCYGKLHEGELISPESLQDIGL